MFVESHVFGEKYVPIKCENFLKLRAPMTTDTGINSVFFSSDGVWGPLTCKTPTRVPVKYTPNLI